MFIDPIMAESVFHMCPVELQERLFIDGMLVSGITSG